MGMITAHSGCDGTKDNSLGFIRYALDSEADCLEVDVRKNAFGELILSHDESEEDCVSLQDAFALLWKTPGKKMNCDLKQEGLELSVYRLALEQRVENRLIYSGTVDTDLLKAKENQLSGIEIHLNIENIYPCLYDESEDAPITALEQERLSQSLEEARRCHAKVINMQYTLITDEVLFLLEEYGLGCSAWTVDDQDKLRTFLEKDIANVTTRQLKQALGIRLRIGQNAKKGPVS